MLQDKIDSELVLEIIVQIKGELSSLIDAEEWPIFNNMFTKHMNDLESSNDVTTRQKASILLVSLLAKFPKVRPLFLSELENQGTRKFFKNIEADISKVCDEIGVDAIQATMVVTMVQESIKFTQFRDEESQRLLIIPKGGIAPGKSIKLSNIRLDLVEITELISGLLLASVDKGLNPLLVIAGILLTIRSIYKIMSVDISAQEASVFWGAVHVRDNNNMVNQEVLTTATNIERQKFGLDALSKDQVINSLHKLQLLGSVERVEGMTNEWQVKENYQFVDRVI
jgi:hypothetical protein